MNAFDREIFKDYKSKRFLKSGKNCGLDSLSKLTNFSVRAKMGKFY